MWMTDYIREIQRKLIEQYGFKENPQKPGVPLNVPDGDYPMKIDGKLDKVKIAGGKIDCCNFGNTAAAKPTKASPRRKRRP